MSNMSYCRFENTASDLRDCIEAVEEASEDGKSLKLFRASLSSGQERDALVRLRERCEAFIEALDGMEG